MSDTPLDKFSHTGDGSAHFDHRAVAANGLVLKAPTSARRVDCCEESYPLGIDSHGAVEGCASLSADGALVKVPCHYEQPCPFGLDPAALGFALIIVVALAISTLIGIMIGRGER